MALQVGLPAAAAWGWEVAPSMCYIGQGMIMGPKTALSMFAGAILGAPAALVLTELSCVAEFL